MTNPTDKELREAAERQMKLARYNRGRERDCPYAAGDDGELQAIADAELLATHALRPATAQQPAAYLTHDGFPVGLEESVEEHAEPLYRGAAPGVLIGWREIPGGCEIMTREDAYNLYGDDIEPVYVAASPSAAGEGKG